MQVLKILLCEENNSITIDENSAIIEDEGSLIPILD